MRREKSRELFRASAERIPGGVNSPVRAFRAVGGDPLFITSARGAWLVDADGNRFVDYVGSWGPALLGHAHPRVVGAVQRAAESGLSFGAPSEGELRLVEAIAARVPAAEKVRLVSSGTEAGMSVVRLARAFTGRDAILKFEGCYHGHADALLAKAGSGVATLGLPDSAGVPADVVRHTLTVPFNDLEGARAAAMAAPGGLAAIILEPVVGNMGVVPPQPGFLEGLRALCDETGALLIIDEVMTGFRVAPGGACERFALRPDVVMLGKVVGGGMPLAAYAGRADVMAKVAPAGPMYQAGTLSGNPVAVAAGRATLAVLGELGAAGYAALEARTAALCAGLREAAAGAGVAACVQQVGSMFTLFFCEGPVRSFADAKKSDTERFGRFHGAMLERGIYLPPSQFEAAFVSFTHGDAEVEKTLAAAREAVRA